MSVSTQPGLFNRGLSSGGSAENFARGLNPPPGEPLDAAYLFDRGAYSSPDTPASTPLDPWSVAASGGVAESRSWADPLTEPSASGTAEAQGADGLNPYALDSTVSAWHAEEMADWRADERTPEPPFAAGGDPKPGAESVPDGAPWFAVPQSPYEARSTGQSGASDPDVQRHIVYSYDGPEGAAGEETVPAAAFDRAEPVRAGQTDPLTGASVEDEIRATQEALQRLQTLAMKAMAAQQGTDDALQPLPSGPVTPDTLLYADPRFAKVTRMMQDGAWPEALEGLRRLRRQHPHSVTLEGLINEAELKAELVLQWDGKITPRTMSVRTERLLRKTIPFGLMLAIFCVISVLYQVFIAPSREVVAQARTAQQLVEQARIDFGAGRYAQAIALYDQVLAQDPNNAAAVQGRAEAERQIVLATEYDLAMDVARNGNYARALAMLETLAAKAPHYRDVELKIGEMKSDVAAQRLFEEAGRAYAHGNWIEAAQKYEELSKLDADYQRETVQGRLPEAYLRAGQAIVAQLPTESIGPKLARDYFRKASASADLAEQAGAEEEFVDNYLRGERFYLQNELQDALNLWLGLYSERPDYLGGYLADQLYRTAILLGDEASKLGDRELAEQMYRTAADLEVRDTSEAERKLQELATATATSTAVAVVVTPQAQARAPALVAAAPAAAAPAATPVPTATPAPAAGPGWIAFRTNRSGGEEVWVMQADGGQQQPAPDDIRARLDELYFREWTSPDGTKQLVVEKPFGRNDNNIYVKDLLASGQSWNVLLVDYETDQYDSVWSPTGEQIAFVSNHTENDEIWIMRSDGTNHRRLTSNEWAWDKHPTWSPDGTRIAFMSNRTGKRQIWVMDTNGSALRNLSNNAAEDWDPVWIKSPSLAP